MSSISSVTGSALNLPLTVSNTAKSAGKSTETNKVATLTSTSNTAPSNSAANILGKTTSVQAPSGVQNLVNEASYSRGGTANHHANTGTLVNTKA